MWFDQSKITALEESLRSGSTTGTRDILDQLSSFRPNPNPYTFCPKCGKPFVKRPLAYVRIVVSACPDGHGCWINEGQASKILALVQSSPRTSNPATVQRFLAFVIWLLVFISFLAVGLLEERKKNANYKTTYSMDHLQNVGLGYWPTRDFSQWNAFPNEQTAITDPRDLTYFYEWMNLMNEGIVNRLNMNDALLAKRPAQEYVDVYAFFAERQNGVIRRLRDLDVPDHLRVFHNYVIEAAVNQVDFYDDYARQKFTNPSLDFRQLLQHPKLKACDQRLWAAYYEFQRIYPARDPATNNAIEQRLCWMDLV